MELSSNGDFQIMRNHLTLAVLQRTALWFWSFPLKKETHIPDWGMVSRRDDQAPWDNKLGPGSLTEKRSERSVADRSVG
jgi:hypothetical protein